MATTDSTNKFDFNEEAAVRAKEETPQLSMLYKVLKTIAIILVWIAIVSIFINLVMGVCHRPSKPIYIYIYIWWSKERE